MGVTGIELWSLGLEAGILPCGGVLALVICPCAAEITAVVYFCTADDSGEYMVSAFHLLVLLSNV